MRWIVTVLILCLPLTAWAEDRLVRLYAPQALVETGLMKHILPRFSLKTQVKVELVEDLGAADMAFGSEGTALFDGAGETWSVTAGDTPAAEKFMAWLTSDVGRNTVMSFAPDGTALFAPPSAAARAETVSVEIGEDALLGAKISREKCARCHAVDDETRMTTIGSTPSFFVLRTFEDWENRFGTFYVLAPHGAFTQIEDLTAPFPLDRPSPIAPVEMTLDELEAVMAYVAVIEAADLGAPIQHK